MTRALTLVVTTFVLASLAVSAREQARGTSLPDGFVPPLRRADSTRPPVVTAPAHSHSLPDYTLEVTLRADPDAPQRSPRSQVVSRTADRVHVADGDHTEWLFVRNPVAPSRVSAHRIDHARRVVVFYDESDVRNLLGVDGWMGVAMLGFDPTQLDLAVPTTDGVRVGEVAFTRYAGPGTSFYWSDSAGLATGFGAVRSGDVVAVSIARATPGVDPRVLREPATRFPQYAAMDVAEWLER